MFLKIYLDCSFYLCIFVCCCLVKSCLTLCNPPWVIVHQAPLFMEFPRQEYWSGLPFPSPGNLPDPRFKPVSLALAAGFFTLNHLESLYLFVVISHDPLYFCDVTCNFSLFLIYLFEPSFFLSFLISLAKDLSVLLIFSRQTTKISFQQSFFQRTALSFINLFYFFFWSLFHLFLFWPLDFFPYIMLANTNFGFVISPFSTFFMCKVR